MELHDTQTSALACSIAFLFDYPMELHDTQTDTRTRGLIMQFDYPMELHDTQTMLALFGSSTGLITLWNYTTLKRKINNVYLLFVWLPYGITRHSNFVLFPMTILYVWLPYGITRHSNLKSEHSRCERVVIPKGISCLKAWKTGLSAYILTEKRINVN